MIICLYNLYLYVINYIVVLFSYFLRISYNRIFPCFSSFVERTGLLNAQIASCHSSSASRTDCSH